MTPETGAHGFDVDIQHHHDEQEQHHHGADVNHHQRHAQEFGLHQHPNHRAHAEGQYQMQSGVHRVFSGNGTNRTVQNDGGKDIEQNRGKSHSSAP